MSGTGSRSSGTSTPHSSPPPLPTLPLLPSPPSFHLPLPSYPPSLGLRAQVRVELGGGGVESSTGYSETQQGGSLCCVESPRWVSKVIRKKHASSVTSVAWHPNNLLLATTCTDNKCRIFSATIKGVDSKSSESSSSGGFSGKFGEQLLQLDLAFGWTFGARWSPSGANLAFVGHDSTIHFINDVGPSLTLHSISLRYLPLRDVLFLSDRLLVAAGFDYNPILFSADANGTWTFVRVLDGSEEPTSTATGAALSAKDTFGRSMERGNSLRSGLTDAAPNAPSIPDSELSKGPSTVHQDCITCIRPLGSADDSIIQQFSTS
ncbi:unnamed protein product, partial [Closterium sp. NIES-65]